MGVSVFPHESFNGIVDALAAWARPTTPVPQPVVVPSVTFGDQIQRALADRCGISMGFDFLTSQDFIHTAVGPGRDSAWSKRSLVWRVLPHASTCAAHLGMRDPSVRDRFALAILLADRLDHYGHFRPEMIRGWQNGTLRTGSRDEDWQRQLWAAIRETIDAPHPALALEMLKADARACRELAERFPELIVLGTAAIDPLLVEVIQLLASGGTSVTIHVLLPSLGYLGEIRSRRTRFSETSNPESIDMPPAHPLLESMARHAVGTFVLLGKLDEQYSHWPEPAGEAGETGNLTLLGRLQSDIRNLRAPGTAEGPDASLRIHACYGPRREVEVLRDEILRAFEEIPGLKPHEVHIVTPDLETYTPLVSAVLRQGSCPLPVRLGELSAAQEDSLADGLLCLLEIARRGEFAASEVIDLVRKPAVLSAIDAADPEPLRRWIRDSGLTHGAGSLAAGAAGFASARLLAGRFFAPEAPVRYPDGRFVLPAGDELGGDSALLGRFLAWFARLQDTVTVWQEPCKPSSWSERLRAACDDLFSGLDNESGEQARRALVFLGDVPCEELLDCGAMLDWLAAECAEPVRRARLGGEILFGRLKQLQNLPCRVLAIVGMHDAAFPASNRAPSWDLLRAEPRLWDRNPRLDDRQLFLDALLTPSDRLIITAPVRNLRTRQPEPFSSCVDEVLRALATMGIRDAVLEHRLQPFAPDYFLPDRPLPRSYDADAAAVARRLLSGNRVTLPLCGKELARPQGKIELTIDDLIRFWKDPARAFLLETGIALRDEEPGDETLDHPPLSLDPLTRWKVQEALVTNLLGASPDPELVRARLAAARSLPPGKLGEATLCGPGETIAQIAQAVRDIHCPSPEAVAYENDVFRITGDVARTCDGAAWFEFRVKKMESVNDFLPAWIRSAVAAAAGRSLPTRWIDETCPLAPKVCRAIEPNDAAEILETLVAGFIEGRTRPLAFAPSTSAAIAAALEKSGPRATREAAEKSWNADGGEGSRPAAVLAWRDLDPFSDMDQWETWACAVAAQVKAWGASE